MRFKQFLEANEGGLVSIAGPYKNNLRICLSRGLYIFRNSFRHKATLDSETDLHWFQETQRLTDRHSVSGNTFLGTWADAMWEGVPKRARSYFASQSLEHSQAFGFEEQSMLIIPRDSINMYAYSDEDFNQTDLPGRTETTHLSELITELVDNLFVGNDNQHRKEIDKIIKDVGLEQPIKINKETISDVTVLAGLLVEQASKLRGLVDNKYDSKVQDSIDALSIKMRQWDIDSVEDYFKKLTPEYHHVKVYNSLSDIPVEPDGNTELWFEGQYLGFNWYDEESTAPLLKALLNKL